MNSIDGNLPNLYISYNTEADCDGAPADDEERWNYACWSQDTTTIISYDDEVEECVQWLNEQGVQNVGEESSDYDENNFYIGTGPAGFKELAELLSIIAINIRKDGLLKRVFGKDVPIIIHGLEYYDYIIDLNQRTNPKSLIKNFVKAMGQYADIKIPSDLQEALNNFSNYTPQSHDLDIANIQQALTENVDELSKIATDNAQNDSEKVKAFMNLLNLTGLDKEKISSGLETILSYAGQMMKSIKQSDDDSDDS
ncbi:MAG: hypothetical protein FWD58_04050 [Firmicutes bacterium]|nr:hypothetical protein [Bacillota bacterium]